MSGPLHKLIELCHAQQLIIVEEVGVIITTATIKDVVETTTEEIQAETMVVAASITMAVDMDVEMHMDVDTDAVVVADVVAGDTTPANNIIRLIIIMNHTSQMMSGII